MRFFKLIFKNAGRHKLRTMLTILGLAIAVMAFVIIRTSVEAWYAGAKASSPNRLVCINNISLVFTLPIAYKKKIEKVPGVTAVSWAYWFGGYYVDEKNFFAQFAIDHNIYMDLYPEILIPPDQKESFRTERNAVIIGQKLADRFGWSIGDPVRITGTIFPGDWDFVIRGIYTGAKETTDETMWFFRYDYLDERMREEMPGRAGNVGWFLIQIGDPAKAAEISETVDNMFVNSLAETKTQTEEAFNLSFVSMASSIITGLRIISILVIGIILLVLANTMAMTARERVSEYAVMKSLGFRSLHILGLIFGESLLIAALGGACGLLLSLPVKILISTAMSAFFPVFTLDPLTITLGFVASVSVGFIAAVFPAMKAINTPIVDGLRIVE